VAEVRVGIVSWNTADLLDRCLHTLSAALGDLDAEVVVVDNASADSSADVAGAYAATHPRVTVVTNEANVGYARAMNQALSDSDAPVLIALNPDTAPPPGSLADLVADLNAHPEAGLVVPTLVGSQGERQHSVYRFPTITVAAVVSFVPYRLQRGSIGRRWALEAAATPAPSGPIDWAIGAVHVIRAKALDGQPPYSQRWFMYVEDAELCWRLREGGWAVRLDAEVTIPHHGNAAGAQAWGDARARRFWDATYDFIAQTRGRAYARALAALNVVGVTFHLATNAIGSRIPGPMRPIHHQVALDLRAVLPVHISVATHGALAPDDDGHIAPRKLVRPGPLDQT